MQFIRATRLAAVLGFALALGLHAQHGAVRSGSVGPAPGGSSVRSFHSAPISGLNLGGRPYPLRNDIPAPVGLNSPASAYTGILPGGLKSVNGYHGGHGHGSRVYPGFIAPPLLLPSYWGTDFSSFPGYDNSAPPVDPNAQALADSQDALAQQIQQLTSEVQQMKNSQTQQQPAAPEPAAPSVALPKQPPAPPVTLVLRDGRHISIENYAVMNQTFWNFSKQPAQRIPLSDIDIAASLKATQENGGEFPEINLTQ